MPGTEDEITTYLDTNLPGTWTAGTNLFSGFMPDSPDVSLAVTLYAGTGPTNQGFGKTDNSNREIVRFQVIGRGAARDYSTARANVQAVRTLLNGLGGVSMSGKQYDTILAVTPVMTIKHDSQDRWYFGVNFEAVKQPS